MSTVINHGAPGSYKTSSALWFEVLTALKAGRLVITNIEGMKSIETIQEELKLTFPDSALLWRISTQNEVGLHLIRNFFSWAPIGALILIDEIQGVYPSSKVDKTFKIEKLVRTRIEDFPNLPQQFKDEFYKRLDRIKPDELEDGDTDDLGITLFDENGHIIYPNDLSDAFNRHRKYNWDIYACTPDIGEVHSIVRGVAEIAHSYKSNDAIGRLIPKYARRPRIFPHKPQSTGLTVSKSDHVFYRKVPLDVHKLYKSTATGAHNDQSKGKTPLSDPKVMGSFFLVFLCIVYYVWYFVGHFSDKEDVKTPVAAVSASIPAIDGKASGSVDSSDIDPKAGKDVPSFADSIGLPYSATLIYLTGVNTVYSDNRFILTRQYIFDLVVGPKTYSLDDEALTAMGFAIEYKSDCMVYVRSSKNHFFASCPPKESQDYIAEKESSSPKVSLL
ncbi:zonular occludens toxin domain-containing protein [Shewanella sp.]|uniref:zonular occludens toxin domain-containing protein n=1 Tax=Shewanella sp. TaxID=50422 RepID=UPI0040546695